MTPFKLAATFAILLLAAGCTNASAEDATKSTATPPAYGPGWRHEQMMQARAQGQVPPAMMAQRGPGYGMMGYGMGRGGPPLKADGTIDTARLPDNCPLKTTAPQGQ